MVRPLVIRSLAAERDLSELFDYIAQDSGVERAELVLRRLDEAISNLAASPLIGRVHPELDGSPRVFALWPWLIAYEPRPTGRGIYVCEWSMGAVTFHPFFTCAHGDNSAGWKYDYRCSLCF